MNPPPLRDMRYVMIVTGIALSILAVLLGAIGALVTGITGSASCGSSGCPSVEVGSWFTWIAVPFLALGIILFAVGLYWGLRVPATAR